MASGTTIRVCCLCCSMRCSVEMAATIMEDCWWFSALTLFVPGGVLLDPSHYESNTKEWNEKNHNRVCGIGLTLSIDWGRFHSPRYVPGAGALPTARCLNRHIESKIAASAAKGVARTGYLPNWISVQGTLDLKRIDKWDGAVGRIPHHTYYGQPHWVSRCIWEEPESPEQGGQWRAIGWVKRGAGMESDCISGGSCLLEQAAATQALLDAAENTGVLLRSSTGWYRTGLKTDW